MSENTSDLAALPDPGEPSDAVKSPEGDERPDADLDDVSGAGRSGFTGTVPTELGHIRDKIIVDFSDDSVLKKK